MPARSTAARIAAAPSCGAAKSFSSPWKAPIGVLAAETITTGSFNMVVSSVFYVKDRRPSGRLGKQLPPDQPAADLGGSRADLVEFGVAPQAPGRVIVDVAVAAETLDRLARHPGRLFGGVENGA